MTMGLVGRKCGMTRVFTEDGISIPVTVIEAQPTGSRRLRPLKMTAIVHCRFLRAIEKRRTFPNLRPATLLQQRLKPATS